MELTEEEMILLETSRKYENSALKRELFLVATAMLRAQEVLKEDLYGLLPESVLAHQADGWKRKHNILEEQE